MRLEQIELSGFKSFVDLTQVSFPSNLVCVVGPNGCGKSNIIDAVRWVMGESSAKQLRGESITDVIFNGSTHRKPVGQASIKLLFDNSDGTLGGQYAGYSQISIRRQVTRDAQSAYFLNGTRCRRRDIIDVFLGTGLGPRSYSIIEQGMISGIIEAKPEELRSYLEEAAGISKYKERRRETENRIKHSRENLSRISDLREELRLQINRLKRQSLAAKRYKVLKEEERLLKAQLLALRWSTLDEESSNFNSVISQKQTLLESHRAELQHLDTEVEKRHDAKTSISDEHNEVQKRYYAIGSEIARIEQTIQHQKERYQQLEEDLQQTEAAWQEATQSLADDELKLVELKQKLVDSKPQVQKSKDQSTVSQEILAEAERQMRDWQTGWDEFNDDASKTTQTAQVEQTRIQHLEEKQLQASQRLEKIDQEQQYLSTDQLQDELKQFSKAAEQVNEEHDKAQKNLAEVITAINQQREQNQLNDVKFDEFRGHLQDMHGRRVALEALQQASMGQKNEVVVKWLEHHQLKDKPRLSQDLQVDAGWESAVETVLGSYLQAICIDGVDTVAAVLNSLEHGHVTLFDVGVAQKSINQSSNNGELLSAKIKSNLPITGLLNGVYITDSLDDAFKMRKSFGANESVITREGVWLGENWVRVAREGDGKSGIIRRKNELEKLAKDIGQQELLFNKTEQLLMDGRKKIAELEQQREHLQQTFSQSQIKRADNSAKLHVKQSQIEQIKLRKERLDEEIKEQQQFIAQAHEDLSLSRNKWQEAMQAVEKNAEIREQLLEKRDRCRQTLDQARDKAHEDQETAHEIELTLQSTQAQIASLELAVERTESQLATLKERRLSLTGDLEKGDSPSDEWQQKLEVTLKGRLEVEKELTAARQRVDNIEHEIRLLEQKRREADDKAQIVRSELEEKRLQGTEFNVRKTTLQEQLAESSFNLEALLQEMPEDAAEQTWQETIEQTAVRISRLGPINLAAIDEYEQAAERKEYLDSQAADLEEALNTLQNAIRRIDRETRTRFKETFDVVNKNFQEIFPRVFGGGKAYLEMTGEDLLDTGVLVMGRPPGKHISSIHLLSGGEKSLTAISLIFSLFQLNPSPFCMLDEVDAALDDMNVNRFCELVKEMSKQVQFIFISHNKGAMEMANHLTGVTMNEPGVSRIVAVDMEAAVAMAHE
jgi:chromosome segregation protein